jgi:nitroimidazol reductase NimA-like FMN-containing flavoprotein (pyridoxamine 5'-phosphate oxidase superfamily)
MLIHELSEEECAATLAQTMFGRLGCARGNQPYVIPVYFAFHRSPPGEYYLYGFATPGQKVEWMRANPLVCVESDQIEAYNRWLSVVVYGRYEELPAPSDGGGEQHTRPPMLAAPSPATPPGSDSDLSRERQRAFELLQGRATWWQPGSAVRSAGGHHDRSVPYHPIYYRVRIDRMTGLRATPDAPEVAESVGAARAPESGGWAGRALRGIAGKMSKWRRGPR